MYLVLLIHNLTDEVISLALTHGIYICSITLLNSSTYMHICTLSIYCTSEKETMEVKGAVISSGPYCGKKCYLLHVLEKKVFL